MSGVLELLDVIALVAIGVILIQRYLKVRNGAYILFLLAIPLWPLMSWPFGVYLRSQIDSSRDFNEISFPLSLLGGTVGEIIVSTRYIEGIVRTIMLLFGFLLLSRRAKKDIEPPDRKHLAARLPPITAEIALLPSSSGTPGRNVLPLNEKIVKGRKFLLL